MRCAGYGYLGAIGEAPPPPPSWFAYAEQREYVRPDFDVALPSLAATAVAAGWGFACAVVTGGEVRCWGHNQSGALGTPDLDAVRFTSAPVLDGADARASRAPPR